MPSITTFLKSLLVFAFSCSFAHRALADCAGSEIVEQFVEVNGIKLHVLSAGSSKQKEMILFLHGFPESSVIWKQYLPAFACAGYFAVAPDMRGYGLSDKPAFIYNYSVPKLVKDVKSLVHAFGYEQTYLVGHDWGGIVSWFVADMEPSLIKKSVIINASHPARFTELLLSNPKQLKASEYIFRLAAPNGMRFLTKNNFAKMRHDVIDGRAVPLTVEEEAELVASWEIPGAVAAGRNYYLDFLFNIVRNNFLLHGIDSPVLMMWGGQDNFQIIENTRGLGSKVSNLELEIIPEATHWLPREYPEQVIQSIETFIKK